MNTDLKYWYLRDHRLFSTLKSDELKQLCVIIGFKKAQKGDIIYFTDTEIPRIYFLKKGAIKIVKINSEGEEFIQDIIQKGDLFGELSLDNRPAADEYAIALTNDVVLCSFLLSDFEALMLRKPDLALSYTKLMGLRFRRISNNYQNLIFKDAATRLGLFLMNWAINEGQTLNETIVINNYLTQNDIAQIICTTRQTVVSLLNEWEKNGIIQYDRKQIVVFNTEKLKKIAKM
ncbi:MAG: Crp/Fnr family transcriptional regulator [Chitinophagales bacterium]|jgi:CRP/FNR family transcriptional regulator|nr:Crp/Fnr family transcriptional regulator [Chitinophagales bacterium]HNL06514.1 Crp/Fnr family transcriptional regulator [Chitinophagales bacterium]